MNRLALVTVCLWLLVVAGMWELIDPTGVGL